MSENRRTPLSLSPAAPNAKAITTIIRLAREAQKAACPGDVRSAKLNQAKIAQGSQKESGERQRGFGLDKKTSLPKYCRECEVRFVCNGGCPKNRFTTTPDGEPGLNALCEGYRPFFNHIDPAMRYMKEALQQQEPPARIMDRLEDGTNEVLSIAYGTTRETTA